MDFEEAERRFFALGASCVVCGGYAGTPHPSGVAPNPNSICGPKCAKRLAMRQRNGLARRNYEFAQFFGGSGGQRVVDLRIRIKQLEHALKAEKGKTRAARAFGRALGLVNHWLRASRGSSILDAARAFSRGGRGGDASEVSYPRIKINGGIDVLGNRSSRMGPVAPNLVTPPDEDMAHLCQHRRTCYVGRGVYRCVDCHSWARLVSSGGVGPWRAGPVPPEEEGETHE